MADATAEEIIALLQKEISQGARRHWEDIIDRKHKDTERRNVQDREDTNSEGENTVADDSMVIDTQTPLHDGPDSQIKQSANSDNGDTEIKGNDGADSGQQGRTTGRSHNWWEEYVQEGADIGELAKKINVLQSSMDNFDPVESLSESEHEHFMDIEVALRYLEQYFGKEGSLKDSDGSEVDLAELQKKAREQREEVSNKREGETTHSYEYQLVSQTVGSESWNKYNPDGIITPELYSEVIKRLRSIISTKTRRRARQTDIKATVRKIANAPATPEIVYKKKQKLVSALRW